MATHSNWRDDSTSFDVDVDTDLDLDATTPLRPFDVRAAFDFDQTVANPDHALITAEREMWSRERERNSSPPPPPSLPKPMPSLYAASSAPRYAAPSSPPPLPRYAAPSSPTNPESIGSIAPTAMELPQSYFPSFTPGGGVKAPPLSIVSTIAAMPHQHAPFVLPAEPARALMSPGRIAVMCGALALAAAVAAFTAASGAESGVAPSTHNAAAPQQETTSIPVTGRNEPPRATALPADVAQLFVPPSDPNTDWRARLMQAQPAAADPKTQR